MTHRFIPSNGVGEIYLDVSNMHWYLYESSCYNIDKEIPFMKLLLDMASLRMRYYTQLNGNRLLLPQTVLNLAYTSSMLIKSFIKIKSLSEDFFCTGDIQTLNYCMHVYSQFIKKEPLDFFYIWSLGNKPCISKSETRTRQISGPIRKTISNIFYRYSKTFKILKKIK